MYEFELIARDADAVASDVDLRSVDEVRLFYGSLLRQSSVSAVRFIECGEVFGSFGSFDEALESYGRAVAKDPGCLRAYLARGELYFELAVCVISACNSQEVAIGDDLKTFLEIDEDDYLETGWKYERQLKEKSISYKTWVFDWRKQLTERDDNERDLARLGIMPTPLIVTASKTTLGDAPLA